MSRAKLMRLFAAVLVGAALWPLVAAAQSGSNPQQTLSWQAARAPFAPGRDAVAGGPGNSPAPDGPMFICRAEVQGSMTPGKWANGKCNVAYGGREIVAHDYQVAYGKAVWRQFGNRNQSDLIQTGQEADGTPLYSCRVRYRDSGRDVGYQPGKIVASGKCDISYAGREVVVNWPFEALYAGNTGTPAVAGGAYAGHAGQRGIPLCKPSDTGVLMKGRTWQGPNCIPVDVMTGQPVYATPLPASDHAERIGAASNKPRELCRKDDPGVTFTANGYAGPNCITSNVYGEPSYYGNATPEERARYKEMNEPCQPGDAGVHVENGMLVGADCKSVPESTAQQDNNGGEPTFGVRKGDHIVTGTSQVNDQQKQGADEKAAEAKAVAAGRAASEADLKAADEQAAQEKAAQEKAEQEKADAEKAAALQKAFADQAEKDKAAAEQRAAEEKAAEESRQAQEAAAKEAEAKATQEQAAAEQRAAEEKAAEESRQAQEAEAKAAQEKDDAEKAAQLQKAFADQAAADKAAKDKEDAEKAAELKKAFEDQAAQQKAEQEKAAEPPPPSEDEPKSEPESGSSSG